MIRAGDSIVNPVTGERLVFELTSHDTGGEYTLFDTFVEPGGAVASAHVHPYQTEIFTVIEGRLGVKRGREKLELAPGEKALIDPGHPAQVLEAGDETLRFRAEVRPRAPVRVADRDDVRARSRRQDEQKGMPGPLRLAVIAKHHFDVVRLPASRTSCRGSRSPPARCSAGRSATRRPTKLSPARRRQPDGSAALGSRARAARDPKTRPRGSATAKPVRW